MACDDGRNEEVKYFRTSNFSIVARVTRRTTCCCILCRQVNYLDVACSHAAPFFNDEIQRFALLASNPLSKFEEKKIEKWLEIVEAFRQLVILDF
jgi:hypothetical protein